jgi:threonine dehydrogenase-like Zn-dependent dehydrogenase
MWLASPVRATVIHEARDIRVEDVPDATIREPTDALVRVTHACICGSDLWPYRGELMIYGLGGRTGHEFMGWSRTSAPRSRRSARATA